MTEELEQFQKVWDVWCKLEYPAKMRLMRWLTSHLESDEEIVENMLKAKAGGAILSKYSGQREGG